MTRVVNIRQDKCDVYIGRGSPFGNPFRIGRDGNREQVIELYTQRFMVLMLTDAKFRICIQALKGKRLGCYCKPLACHGDVIVDYLDGGES